MKKYLLIIIVVTICGALPLFLQYGDYLFCTDYFKQQIPFIAETKRMLSSGTPFWSWNTYYGDNFWASYGFYTLTSPFVWLLCLLPYSWLLKGCFAVLILKYICAFLAAHAYLRKMDITEESASVGGLLYAFSSYAISNSFYFHFFEPLIVFPLLLIAIERFVRKERYACVGLLFASFLTIFVNYYFALGSFIAAAMYVFCRWLFSDVKLGIKRLALGVALVGIGIIMDAFILIPTAMQISGGPRTGGHLTGLDFTAFPYFVERLRVLFMPQVIEQPTSLFRLTGFHSNSVCLPVLGMLGAALYCWKNKRSWIAILVVLGLLAFLSPANTIFSGMTNPNYTRWAYALCLFLILASCKWLDDYRSTLRPRGVAIYALIVACVFGFALYIGLADSSGNPVQQMIGESRSFILLAYTVLAVVNLTALFLFSYKQNHRILVGGVAVCAILQMGLFYFIRSDAYFNAAKDTAKSGLVSTYIKDNSLPRSAEPMHYRTAFSGRYDNMPMLSNRAGVTTSHSIQNNVIRSLIIATDSCSDLTRIAASPNCNRRSFYALMSVKELIAYDDRLAPFNEREFNITKKEQGNGYKKYENKDYLPMGFTYDSYVEESIIDSLNLQKPKADIPLLMLANLAVPEKEQAFFAKYLQKGNVLSANSQVASLNLDSIIIARRKSTASSFEGTTTGFTSSITLPEENIVFYSCPADKGFTAYVDGQETLIHPCNLGLSAVLVPKGQHTVEFKFLPRGLKEGACISLIMLFLAAGIAIIERKKITK